MDVTRLIEKERPVMESKPAAKEGTSVRDGSSLADIVRLLDGTRTLEEITKEARLKDGEVIKAVDKARHRISYVLPTKHGIGIRVDGRGRIKCILPRNIRRTSGIA